jgi:hypothetical protein
MFRVGIARLPGTEVVAAKTAQRARHGDVYALPRRIMKPETRQALAAPFPAEAVKRRRGSFGKPVNFVCGSAVVARLNDCFDGDWSFAIVEHRVLATGEVLVHGKLTALGIIKEAFGKAAPAISRETGEVLSEADAYKAAATDSLKKCATMLGVAAYLYADDVPDQPVEKAVPGTQGNPARGTQAAPAKAVDTRPVSNTRPVSSTQERLTPKQLQAIWNLGRKLGLGAEAVRQRAVEGFGKAPEQLGRADASALITALGEEIGKRSAA